MPWWSLHPNPHPPATPSRWALHLLSPPPDPSAAVPCSTELLPSCSWWGHGWFLQLFNIPPNTNTHLILILKLLHYIEITDHCPLNQPLWNEEKIKNEETEVSSRVLLGHLCWRLKLDLLLEAEDYGNYLSLISLIMWGSITKYSHL